MKRKVVIGADSSKGRFNAVSTMFNYAFGNFRSQKFVVAGESVGDVRVSGGKERRVDVTVSEDVTVLVPRNDKSEAELRIELPDRIKAPVKAGDAVGKGYVVREGNIEREFDLVAARDVERASLWDLIKRIGSPR